MRDHDKNGTHCSFGAKSNANLVSPNNFTRV
jgi:hypothetical protein